MRSGGIAVSLRMMLDAIFDRLKSVSRLLSDRGWAEGPEGNVSIRLPGDIATTTPDGDPPAAVPMPVACRHLGGRRLLISSTGSRFRDLAEEPRGQCSLLRIGGDGLSCVQEALDGSPGPSRRPTSELPTHLLAHDALADARPEYTALLHAHVNELIAMSLHPELQAGDSFTDALMSIHPEMPVYFPAGIGCIPYVDAGTTAIGKATAAEFHSMDIVIWQRHGVLAIGRDIDEALDRIAIAAKAAALWLMCRRAGFDPRTAFRL
jgi:rhamnulose-1-phosphate aldolase